MHFVIYPEFTHGQRSTVTVELIYLLKEHYIDFELHFCNTGRLVMGCS